MIYPITIGNDLETFYTNFNDMITKMFPYLNININRISSTINYISIQNSANQMIMDMYALSLLPNDNNVENRQIVLCNNLSVSNTDIDFTSITNSNIGPCFYTYDSNNNVTAHTYWINNTYASQLLINTGDTNLDSIYKQLYTFSFDTLMLASNDNNQPQYLWIGFSSYQEQVPMFFISVTNQSHIGVFGITDSLPTYNTTMGKFLTTSSNSPITYNLNDLVMDSTITCLINIVIPQSIENEYFPYLYLCTGKDSSNSAYIQFDNDGVEYYKILNGISAITSNPKFTLYQKIKYRINLYDIGYYTISDIKLISNTDTVTIDWGDGSTVQTVNAGDSANITHTYTSGGTYDIEITYVSLENPNYISNIATIDKYTTSVNMAEAFQLTALNIINIFKFDTSTSYESVLYDVKLPPNITAMNVDGFCENCTDLNSITLPTANCTMTGQWLYNSALDFGNISTFLYPSNITFVKNSNNAVNDFYTGNFASNVMVNSNITCDTFYIGNDIETLTLNSNILCSKLTGELNSLSEYDNHITTLNIRYNCNFNNTEICNLPDLRTLNIYDDSATTTIYNLNHLDSLTTLNVSDYLTSIVNISYCNSLQSIGIPETVTSIGNTVGDYCNSFTSFVADNDNLDFTTLNGVLYDKLVTTLIKIPYGYTNVSLYELPQTVVTIGANSMFTKNPITLISLANTVTSISNNFATNGHIVTLIIDSDILTFSTFSTCTIDNLVLGENVSSINTGIFSNVEITSLTVYNENLVLNTNQFDLSHITLIKGYVGSTAETFANDNNITFIPVSFGTNRTVYDITIPTNNYTLNNVCSLSQSYSQIDWGDNSEPETIYNFADDLTHTYETAGDYTVTITHISPSTIDFSYTNINQGLFSVATSLDFSALTLCSNVVTNLFNNLSGVEEIVYPPNILSITNTLNGTNNVTSITLPTALTTLINSFDNQNYNSLTALTLPNGLTAITNSFNNTNVIKGTTLSLDTTDTTNGITITNSFNSCSTTLQTLTFGENVFSVVNSFMNLLAVSTLTVNASNTHLSVTNNLLCNYAGTELILVPGGLSTFTIPSTVTTLLQGCIANVKTYTEVIIPLTVTTINFPFYNSLNEQGYTTITNIRLLNPYTSMADINKVIETTEGGVTTYLDTANVTGIIAYEHSVGHSQIDGYSRYINCSTYIFTSLGYYNSSIVLGSSYTSQTFTNAQLISISDNLISAFNTKYNYIMPDKTVYGYLSELIAYLTNNTFDFTEYPYVIFYHIDTVNNMYNYILYVLNNTYSGMSITIDSADTYNSRKISVNYDITNTQYTNLVDDGSFTNQSIITSAIDTYEVLTYNDISAILTSDNTNITPSGIKYTTLIQENPNVSNAFIGYIIGSTNSGTNKLFLTNPIIRIDDYWLNVDTDLIDADNVTHINAYNINSQGNFVTTSISGNLPLSFNGYGEDLVNYNVYGTTAGAGVQTINLLDVNAKDTANGYIPDAYLNSVGEAFASAYYDVSEYIPVNGGTRYSYCGARRNEPAVCFYDSSKQFLSSTQYTYTRPRRFTTPSDAAYVRISIYDNRDMLLLGEYDETPAYEPFGYKIPLTLTTEVTEEMFDKDAKDTEKGFVNGSIINSSGVVLSSSQWCVSEYIPIKIGVTYRLYWGYDASSSAAVAFYNTNKEVLGGHTYGSTVSYTFTPDADGYLRFSYRKVLVEETSLSTSEQISDNYPLYIGPTKLGEEEYADFVEQKVYKRTENLWNPAMDTVAERYITSSGSISSKSENYSVSDFIPMSAETEYTISSITTIANAAAYHAFYDANQDVIETMQIGKANQSNAFTTPQNCAYARFTFRSASVSVGSIMLVEGSTLPETFIPYLQPTDPPVPFPAINAYNNSNTLSSTETLGNVLLQVSNEIPALSNITEDVDELKLIRTDKYMFENNVELVSPKYELPTT